LQQLPHSSSQKNFNWTNRKHSYDGSSTRFHQSSQSNFQLAEARQGQTQRDPNGAHSIGVSQGKKQAVPPQINAQLLSPVASLSGRGFPTMQVPNSVQH